MERTLNESTYVVASLVAKGMTNKQVADTLGLSVRTVQSYLSSEIFPTLEINSRSQLVAIFAQNPPKCLNRVSGWEYKAKFLEKCTEPITAKQAASLLGCSEATAGKYLRQHNMSSRRRTCKVTHENQTRTLSEWAVITGIPRATLWERICDRKWDIEKALTQSVNKKFWAKEKRDC